MTAATITGMIAADGMAAGAVAEAGMVEAAEVGIESQFTFAAKAPGNSR